MGIKANFNEKDVRDYILQQSVKMAQLIVLRLQRAGEMFVNLARENGNYTDRTGNLRNSIGYMILKDGLPMHENFLVLKGSNEGKLKARALAILEAPKQGYVLIGVAGMEYAAGVESMGKDVITGSAQAVEKWLKEAMRRAV